MTSRHLHRVLCGVAVGALAFFVGEPLSAIEMTPELKKVVDGAKAEGTFTVEAPPTLLGGAEGVAAARDWMNREFGITLRGNHTPNPVFQVVISKIYTEMQAKQRASSDVFIGGVSQTEPMLDRGIFRRNIILFGLPIITYVKIGSLCAQDSIVFQDCWLVYK